MLKFYQCNHCKQIIIKLEDKKVPVFCCGEAMKELIPNSTDAAGEKHVPVIEQNGNLVKVSVGSVAHPMLDVHYITMVILETNLGYQVKHLKPEMEPVAYFTLNEGEEVVNAYEYCNLHSLWSAR